MKRSNPDSLIPANGAVPVGGDGGASVTAYRSRVPCSSTRTLISG